MKRAKDRWTSGHLAVGILFLSCLALPHALGAKATSLFRTTTTPTTTTADPSVEEGADPEEIKTNGTETDSNSTYIWIPQKDYVRDPNLPRELNGYNLSSYPFLATVPPLDEIKFKCEESLHDGFYANVEYKCQVYHQCLYGFRYDFLCANYTAFDQKTFICHFVSEVDCVGSHKYWKKNDDLYKATTAAPVPTTPSTTTTTTPAPPPPRPRPGGRRRPSRRRRPQYDYYDDEYYPSARDEEDYYEDDARRSQSEGRGGSRRRKRPRPAQRRPAYDDDYEDDRYERRQEGRTRVEEEDYEDRRSNDRPRKGNRRPADDRDRSDSRKPVEDRDRDRSESRKPVEDRDRPDNRKPYEEEEASTRGRPSRPPFRSADKRTSPTTESDRRSNDDDRRSNDDDRRGYDRPRRPFRDEKPLRDVSEEKEVRITKEERPYRDERPSRDRPFREEARDRPHRAEDRPKNEGRNNRDQQGRIDESREEPKKDIVEPTAGGALVKPIGASIYNRPRVAPKIARPVPLSEKNKFKYVTAAPTTAAPSDDEYYDDYEIEDTKSTSPSIKSSLYSRARPEKVEREVLKPSSDKMKSNFDQDASIPLSGASGISRQRRPDVRRPSKEDYEEVEEVRPKRPSSSRGRDEGRYSSRKRPVKVEEEYYYDDEDTNTKSDENRQDDDRHTVSTRDKQQTAGDVVSDAKLDTPNQKNLLSKNKESTPSTTTSTEAPTTAKNAKNQGFVRVVKRPFLPSRGGSPYLPRGLQPLGGKNVGKTTTTVAPLTTTSTTQQPSQLDYSYETDYDVKDDKPASNDKKLVENYSAEYSQSGEQSYEANDKPKVDKYSSSERNFDKQISYTQSKQKADEINQNRDSEALNDSSKYQYSNSKGTVSGVEEDNLSPNYESDYRDNIQYDTPPQQEYNQVTSQPEKLKEKQSVFKASPQFTPEPYKPTSRPYTPKIPENISIKQNLADVIESDYDVTLNDALNPTLPNLTPIRNFPSPFIASPERDYTYSRFRNNYQAAGSQQYNQYRNQDPGANNVKYSPPQRIQGAYRNVADSSIASSESHGISARAPQAFYVQQPKYSASFSAGETNSGLRPSHGGHRQATAGDYYV